MASTTSEETPTHTERGARDNVAGHVTCASSCGAAHFAAPAPQGRVDRAPSILLKAWCDMVTQCGTLQEETSVRTRPRVRSPAWNHPALLT
mmetsp:Transcript_50413/g.133967  ORF Transcript_50413/g.133967 Transcript_50413/m.133967 type:complete len:91 (+) Transcript_50413:1301-1573(+)